MNEQLQASWDIDTDVVVVGAGGCGMVASLAAAEEGVRVVLLEKTGRPGGNTAMSQGMIPAAGTRFQREAGFHDSPETMAQDIFRKNNQESDASLTLLLCSQSKHLVEWLVDVVGIDLRLVTQFVYPGHTQFRMHAPPDVDRASPCGRSGRSGAREGQDSCCGEYPCSLTHD